jgi:hypothetical protein
VNPDESKVLVAYNDSPDSRTFQIVARRRSLVYTLPALSGATFTWIEPEAPHRTFAPSGARPPRLPVLRDYGPYQIGAAEQRIMASSYNGIENLQSEPCSDAAGGYDVGYSGDGSWLEFDNIDFTMGVHSVDVRLASPAAGGTLHLRLDRKDGPEIGLVTIPSTGGWQTWQTVNVPVSGATGRRSLYVVYSGASPPGGLANLNWLQFK